MSRQEKANLYTKKYFSDLEEIIDILFEKAKDNKWTWDQFADNAGLSTDTVKNLGIRRTMYPWLKTIMNLARAVGATVHLDSKSKGPKRYKITWTPSSFSSHNNRKITSKKQSIKGK